MPASTELDSPHRHLHASRRRTTTASMPPVALDHSVRALRGHVWTHGRAARSVRNDSDGSWPALSWCSAGLAAAHRQRPSSPLAVQHELTQEVGQSILGFQGEAVPALLEYLRTIDLLGHLEHLLLDQLPEELRRADGEDRHADLGLLELLVDAAVLQAHAVGLQHAAQSSGRLDLGDPLGDGLVADRRRIVGLGLDPELPELTFATGDQHLRQMGDPEEGDVPDPHALEVELRGHVLWGEE